MPRHAFSFPPHVREAVRRHVAAAVRNTDPTRHRQESAYLGILLGKLDGPVYDDRDAQVSFRATTYDDRGRNAAESLFGADFAITADISDSEQRIVKGIVAQAKLGEIADLTGREMNRLRDQIRRMRRIVNAPKVLEAPRVGARRAPRVLSGNRILSGRDVVGDSLEVYMVRRILTTLDGTVGEDFVATIEDSQLTRLRVHAESG